MHIVDLEAKNIPQEAHSLESAESYWAIELVAALCHIAKTPF
jgi:hypothetical protein